MNQQHLQLLVDEFMRRHWPNIEHSYAALSQLPSLAARNALVGALAAEVMSNPPKGFHAKTGGEYSNIGKANTRIHKEVKPLLIAAITSEGAWKINIPTESEYVVEVFDTVNPSDSPMYTQRFTGTLSSAVERFQSHEKLQSYCRDGCKIVLSMPSVTLWEK